MLDVHDVRVEQSTEFVPPGGLEAVFLVHFMAGPHGPFTLRFKRAEFTQARIAEDQQKIVRTLEELAGRG